MASLIEQIKEKLKLEELVGETFAVTGRGHTLTTTEHDSLKIDVRNQRWRWYSSRWEEYGRIDHGDLFDWYQLIHRCDLRQAIEELAEKAGVELRQMAPAERQAWEAERSERRTKAEILELATRWFEAQMWGEDDAGRRYCMEERGWTEETIRRERVGYYPKSWGDKKALSVGGSLTGGTSGTSGMNGGDGRHLSGVLREAGVVGHVLSRAVLSLPQGAIVYAHQERGQVVYLSARGVEQKRHYNLPLEIEVNGLPTATGVEKRVYCNEPVKGGPGARVLVEGQGDAISLSQLGIDAVALCSLPPAEGLGERGNAVSHVGLDNDIHGEKKAMELALSIDPLCRVIEWPKTLRHREPGRNHVTVKDAGDLTKGAMEPDEVTALLENSLTAIERLAIKASRAKDDERKELLRRFFGIFDSLEQMVATDIKPDLTKHLCGGSLAQFGRLLKAYKDEQKANGENDAPERYEYSAGGAIGGLVWEQCIAWDTLGVGAVVFAVRANGKIEYRKTVDIGNVTYVPYPASLGVIKNKRIVLFPERAEEYGSEKQLVHEVQTFLHDFFDFGDPFYEKLAAYYVLFSWMYDVFENLPYLRALGDYGTGKTRFIQTIGVLCYRPMLVSGASTASPVFRLIDMFRGTLVMDEADFANSDSDNEIIKIINVGYYKGGCVMRAEKEADADVYSPETYDVFGPKILATRKPFTDRAVESRCLTKRTTTARPRPGIPFILNESFWTRSQTLRNRLLMYRLRNYRMVVVDETLANQSVEPRLNQVTMALKSIITDTAMRDEIDTFIAVYNETLISDRQMTMPAVIVQTLAAIQHNKKTDMLGNDLRDFTMKGIAEKAQQLLIDIDPDTKVYPRMVSKILNEELGLIRRRPHPENRRAMVVFEQEELTALMQRYGIENYVQ